MPRISQTFRSRFVKNYELSYDTRFLAKILDVGEERFNNDAVDKLVLRLTGENGWIKDLVLNQNNAQRLAAALGDNTDDWQGAAVELWVEDIEFRGVPTASIKIGPASAAALPPPPDEPEEPPPPLDDSIPF